jgi:hypothetical protein
VPYVHLGDVTVVLDTPALTPPLTDSEVCEAADGFAAYLAERLDGLVGDLPGVRFKVEVEYAVHGCIRTRLRVGLAGGAFALASTIAMYAPLRESVILLLTDAANIYNCVIRDHEFSCPRLDTKLRAVEHLHQVKKGESLSRIVVEVWGIAHVHQHKTMRWVLKNYPDAFIGGNINKLKVGSVIGKPTQAHIEGKAGI